jgi:hypothetical protein
MKEIYQGDGGQEANVLKSLEYRDLVLGFRLVLLLGFR